MYLFISLSIFIYFSLSPYLSISLSLPLATIAAIVLSWSSCAHYRPCNWIRAHVRSTGARPISLSLPTALCAGALASPHESPHPTLLFNTIRLTSTALNAIATLKVLLRRRSYHERLAYTADASTMFITIQTMRYRVPQHSQLAISVSQILQIQGFTKYTNTGFHWVQCTLLIKVFFQGVVLMKRLGETIS